MAARASQARGRVIGLVPEIKHPSHFAALGLAMEQPLREALAAHPYTRRAPVLIQSFEVGNLRALREKLPRGGMRKTARHKKNSAIRCLTYGADSLGKMVEPGRIELPTSSLRTTRSPS